MQEKLSEIKSTVLPAVESAKTLAELDAVRVGVVGKNGSLTAMMKEMGALSIEEKKVFGAAINAVKMQVMKAIEDKKSALEDAELNQKLQAESIDVTLPCRPQNVGRIHPITQAIEESLTIFAQMGFDLAEGPDIEDDWHNFEALNLPKEHPARQMQATFFFDNKNMLRTQTSGVQIRTMENQRPPIKIVCPGRTYRRDYDATHTPMFHQIEGLVIDEKTNLANLRSVLMEFFKLFFETDDVAFRFRTSYFPFTEPSYEMDLGGVMARNIGKEWLEMGGCGIVDPRVLKNCGIDPDKYQGFAFGIGLDRLAMMKYGIKDLRPMFEADMKWIKHYGFLPLDVPTITSGLSLNGGKK
ncbi:MAG: phenylalanine--tRNA ligase subunit alpha [Alphaproteobacteria bacterium]|nr:phenylalanine--tRNA ligase subunit alpha [Alphaproteobacteria bacterium]